MFKVILLNIIPIVYTLTQLICKDLQASFGFVLTLYLISSWQVCVFSRVISQGGPAFLSEEQSSLKEPTLERIVFPSWIFSSNAKVIYKPVLSVY